MSLTLEQLKFRQTGIGGSDVAAIIGISKWKTPLELYQEKTHEPMIIEETNDAMHFGSLHEPMILAEFKRRNPEMEVYGCDLTSELPDIPWIKYSPDGYVIENGNKGIFEAKTARSDQDWEDGVPDYYACQVMWYMFAEELSFAYVAVLFGGNEWRQYKIEANHTKEQEMYNACSNFWHKHVVPRSPAGLTERSSFGDLTIIFPPPTKEQEFMVGTTDIVTTGLIDDLRTNIAKRKALDEENDKLKAAIIKISGGAGRLVSPSGETVANYIHVQPKPSVSVRKIMAEQPQLAAMYPIQRKPYRTFRVATRKT